MKVGHQLKDFKENKSNSRVTIFGFDKNLTAEDSQAYREYFSKLGKLEFYYFVKMRCDKIKNDEINHYIKVNGIQSHQYDKVNLLNVSYLDPNIINKLKHQKIVHLNGKELTISEFTEFKKLEQDDVEPSKNVQELNKVNNQASPTTQTRLFLKNSQTLNPRKDLSRGDFFVQKSQM